MEKKYKIQSEVGAILTSGHKVIMDSNVIYDSTVSFFEQTGSREAFKSNLFRGLMLEMSSVTSIRKGAGILDRMRRTNNGIIPATYRNSVEREGESIQRSMEEAASKAIEQKGLAVSEDGTVTWRESGAVLAQGDFEPSGQIHIDDATVHAAAKKARLEEGTYNPSDFELHGVNISCDEVGVRRQTESRPKKEGAVQAKRVENTVIHVEMSNESENPKLLSSSSYILNSLSVSGAFKTLLGFLCINGLLDKTLVFFVDGARNLNTTIASMFGYKNIKIILDWYHLRKKMEETLSRICNNTIYRNEMLQKVMPILWKGDIDAATAVLKEIDMKMVKNESALNYLIGYLERVRKTIPNYMLRAELGLRNSSNRGEKANDLIVSNRQKHNGMSWSDDGSATLASVTAALYNDELGNWIEHGSLSLRMVERTTPKRPKRNRKRTEVAYSNPPAKKSKVKAAA